MVLLGRRVVDFALRKIRRIISDNHNGISVSIHFPILKSATYESGS